MRNSLMGLLVILLLFACKKEQLAPTTPLNEMVIDTTKNGGGTDSATLLKFSGNFSSGPYGVVSGMASIYKTAGTYALQLTNFNVSNGPDLHVYLAKEAMPVHFIDLGALKSTNGNQVYAIPNQPDFTVYQYVSIHCVAYNHLFGSAQLK